MHSYPVESNNVIHGRLTTIGLAFKEIKMVLKRKKHWEKVYDTTNSSEWSWTQEFPKTSLDLINSFGLTKEAKIKDVGGGDSNLVDFLLDQGFENITVLDISSRALDKAKKRLGEKADMVNWIVCDITEFETNTTFDLWHDRATFHFLTTDQQIDKYLEIARKSVSRYLIIGAFSQNGPKKCSGLDVQ